MLFRVSVCMCVISDIHVSVDLHITGAYYHFRTYCIVLHVLVHNCIVFVRMKASFE